MTPPNVKLIKTQKAAEALTPEQIVICRRAFGRAFFEALPAAKLAVDDGEEGKPEKPTAAADHIAWAAAMEEGIKAARNGTGTASRS